MLCLADVGSFSTQEKAALGVQVAVQQCEGKVETPKCSLPYFYSVDTPYPGHQTILGLCLSYQCGFS